MIQIKDIDFRYPGSKHLVFRDFSLELNEDCLFISAKNKENIDEFREILYKKVRELHVQKYPYNDFLYQDYE